MSQKRFVFSLFSLVFIASFALVCSAVLHQSSNALANTQTIQATSEPMPTDPGYSVGVKAITHVGTGTTPTLAEVKAFVLGHRFALDSAQADKPTTVTDVEFITASAASAKLHGESIGLPDTAMVIFVKVHGSFTFTAMSLPPGIKGGPPHVNDAVEVFDAATGNLLLAGTA